MTLSPVSFPLGGGLDLVTPELVKPPGRVIGSLNYEPVATGYKRFRGYERFDGRTAPSSSTNPTTIATLRAAITAVPGSGPVRGVHHHAGFVIAARDNSGGTAGVLHKASSTGWQEVVFDRTLAFTSGDTNLILGIDGVIVGATSGASAVLTDVTVTSGSLGAGTAAGTLSLSSQSGTFVAENINLTEPATANVATVAGNSVAVGSFAPLGTYKFITHNFYGASNLTKIYGVNGVGKGFFVNWSARQVVFITTGMTVDKPNRLAEHNGSLFYAFPGGSIQFSTVGDPEDWSPVTGAGEIGIGTDITDLATLPDTLAIYGENGISLLYGNDSSDYLLKELTDAGGALPHTVQEIGGAVHMDNSGLRTLKAAATSANFSMGTISRLIEPLIKKKRDDSIEPSATLVCRRANQYWLFWEDGTGIIVYLGGKEPSILPFNLGITVTCATSYEDDGEERLFVGASNGFVYELNKGTSFDGATIEHYLTLPYYHLGMPQHEKRVGRVDIDVEVSGTTTISVAARLDRGTVDGVDAQTLSLTAGGSAIDDLGTGESYYTSRIATRGETYLDVVCTDVSLKISGSTSTQEPHTLTGVTFLASPRRLKR